MFYERSVRPLPLSIDLEFHLKPRVSIYAAQDYFASSVLVWDKCIRSAPALLDALPRAPMRRG